MVLADLGSLGMRNMMDVFVKGKWNKHLEWFGVWTQGSFSLVDKGCSLEDMDSECIEFNCMRVFEFLGQKKFEMAGFHMMAGSKCILDYSLHN